MGARDELYGDDPGPPLPSRSFSASTTKSPAGRGRTGCLPGFCGAPCSRSSILSLRCRLSTILRRRWWNSWSISSISLACTHPSSRLSTCPRSHKTGLGSAWLITCFNRRLRNNWWQCLRSFLILLCTGMWSRTSKFQFLTVVVVGTVFKIYVLDRFQQRFVEQITWKIRFRVLAVFKVSSRDTLPLLHPRTRLVLRMMLLQGLFALFPK